VCDSLTAVVQAQQKKLLQNIPAAAFHRQMPPKTQPREFSWWLARLLSASVPFERQHSWLESVHLVSRLQDLSSHINNVLMSKWIVRQ
jgi:hypothetical protein